MRAMYDEEFHPGPGKEQLPKDMPSRKRFKKRCTVISFSGALLVVVSVLLTLLILTLVIKTEPKVILASTPPMGWNSWNHYRCDGLSSQSVMATADAMVTSGLRDAGYVYVSIDDCWQAKRDRNGVIQPDTSQFPDGYQGMQTLGDYLRSLRLKFGVYTSIGTMTCRRRPGSFSYEIQDAKTYASWGVDFLKNDDCYVYPNGDPYLDYMNMTRALAATGRNIIHNIKGSVPVDKAQTVGHMRRVGRNMYDNWDIMLSVIDIATDVRSNLAQYAKPGFWNDLDSLQVGNGGMSPEQYVTHFSFWCALKAPLFISNDVIKMDQFTTELLTHSEMIAMNQASSGKPIELIKEAYAEKGHTNQSVTSHPCAAYDTNQHWFYDSALQQLKHKKSGLCTRREDDEYLSVQRCDTNDLRQKWFWNETSMRLISGKNNDRSHCLATGERSMVASRVVRCDDRSFFGYSSYFIYKQAGGGAFMVTNTNSNQCLSVGGKPEIQIYAGALAHKQYSAMLLNRDNSTQIVRMRLTDIHGIEELDHYVIRDVYMRKDLGIYSGHFQWSLYPKSSILLILTFSY